MEGHLRSKSMVRVVVTSIIVGRIEQQVEDGVRIFIPFPEARKGVRRVSVRVAEIS